jgi:RNA polymerase sigma-70 factor, ECF subfamily
VGANPVTVSGTGCEPLGSTSSSLIKRVKSRDEQAWRRMVRLYGPLVDFWVRRTGLQHADSHDVFQEVFTAVAQGIGRFHKDRPGDTFRGWLRTIVRSKVADHHRKSAGQPRAIGGSDANQRLQYIADANDTESSCAGCDERQALRDLRLRTLELVRSEFEPRSWEAFWRVQIDRRTTKEVAEALGMTLAAVRMAKSRVLRRVREELGELES